MHNIRTVSVCVLSPLCFSLSITLKKIFQVNGNTRESRVALYVLTEGCRAPGIVRTTACHRPGHIRNFVLLVTSVSYRAVWNFTGLWTKKNLRSGRLVVASVFCLSAFKKLRKVTINLVVSVCPPYGRTLLRLDEFSWNLTFEYFF